MPFVPFLHQLVKNIQDFQRCHMVDGSLWKLERENKLNGWMKNNKFIFFKIKWPVLVWPTCIPGKFSRSIQSLWKLLVHSDVVIGNCLASSIVLYGLFKVRASNFSWQIFFHNTIGGFQWFGFNPLAYSQLTSAPAKRSQISTREPARYSGHTSQVNILEMLKTSIIYNNLTIKVNLDNFENEKLYRSKRHLPWSTFQNIYSRFLIRQRDVNQLVQATKAKHSRVDDIY